MGYLLFSPCCILESRLQTPARPNQHLTQSLSYFFLMILFLQSQITASSMVSAPTSALQYKVDTNAAKIFIFSPFFLTIFFPTFIFYHMSSSFKIKTLTQKSSEINPCRSRTRMFAIFLSL